jgi:hypothetical protein
MTRSHGVRQLAVGSAALLFGLFLVGSGAVAGATPNEHSNEAATAHGARPAQRGGHAADKEQAQEQDAAPTEPQPASNADFSGHGANDTGAYDSTRDGSPSRNGNGTGTAVGKPCAGCVGKADNKNPAGQSPNGSDANKGYECDDNSGIGKTNPAHTGCLTDTDVDVPTTPEVPLVVLGETFTRTPPAVLSALTPAAPAGTLATTGAGSTLTTLALTGLGPDPDWRGAHGPAPLAGSRPVT